jgi:hypothetical protein
MCKGMCHTYIANKTNAASSPTCMMAVSPFMVLSTRKFLFEVLNFRASLT